MERDDRWLEAYDTLMELNHKLTEMKDGFNKNFENEVHEEINLVIEYLRSLGRGE